MLSRTRAAILTAEGALLGGLLGAILEAFLEPLGGLWPRESVKLSCDCCMEALLALAFDAIGWLPVFPAMQHIPPPRAHGPTTFEDIWKWPADLNDKLFQDDGMRERYIKNLQDGVRYRLHYAGCLTETVGMNFVADDLRKRGVDGIDVKTVYSCDFADAPQKIFHHMPEEARPLHGFEDIEDLLPMEVRWKLDDMQPDFSDWTSAKTEVDKKRVKEEHMQAYTEMAKYLKRQAEKGALKGCRAKCIRHDTMCSTSWWEPGASFTNALKIESAGTICVAWSDAGDHMGYAHPSMRTMLVWAAVVLNTSPDVISHECVKAFPIWVLESFFGRDYVMTTFESMSPVERGLPSTRDRRYTFFFKRDTVRFLGSSHEFEAMFDKECVLPGSVYYKDTEENVKKEFVELAERRKLNATCMCHKMDWKEIYSPGAVARLDAAVKSNRCDLDASEDIVVDVDRVSASGYHFPSLVTHGIWYSTKMKRHMTPRETLCVAGIPAVPAATNVLDLPWKKALDTMRPAEVKTLAGNTMHMVAATQLQAYVIANTQKLEPLPRSSSIDFDDLGPDVIEIEDDSQVADVGLANIAFEGTGVGVEYDETAPSSSKRRRAT